MYEVFVILIAVILTCTHFFIKILWKRKRYNYLYLIQFFALFSSFSIAEHFFEKPGLQFFIGTAGFFLFVVNLLLMVARRKS
ncbi:hypothetical protein S4054249_07560 [Pseudoalteromonas luteoviolacea]|uniref:Uncharacterized protein n=1 Tax=Pseudoalteromonas luteoviolacea S4054 TaxID=1129367 RepID=A0A0F6AGC2_9GAMM|nr:hypothetical protein S4054249_07560 [Pseudoalteromonas luteoviolacea]AOT12626.1 hypothetical protein S40542_07560 [Pseudoalteromonas luteoviolacea]AOT17540.1 hypothetical protein S4054_07560 [Pseudoalteromonas luteoviolacea]KKE84826.1 hypothetical protein N479_26370 [Pseudoalteromonas luteoviolacea S4054]KZN74842.1 hypothetical protein N481_26585 [Pseudoalteromonas luteoviolacea S4047-1]